MRSSSLTTSGLPPCKESRAARRPDHSRIAKLREYLGYVLLDFVTADPDLDEMPLAAALDLCRELDLDPQFETLASKELKIKDRDLKRIKEQAAKMLARRGGGP